MTPQEMDDAVLAALKSGRRSLAELADSMDEDKPFILRRLNALMDRGFVSQNNGDTFKWYQLTHAGAEAIRQGNSADPIEVMQALRQIGSATVDEVRSAAAESNISLINPKAYSKPPRSKEKEVKPAIPTEPIILRQCEVIPELRIQIIGKHQVLIEQRTPVMNASEHREILMVPRESLTALIDGLTHVRKLLEG